MARLFRAADYKLRSFSSSSSSSSSSSVLFSYSLMSRCLRNETILSYCPTAISTFLLQTRPYASESVQKSPFEANVIRILTKEIQYQSDYAPPHQPPTIFKSFTVQDRPGEQWITMSGKFGDTEDIKIKVTMFNGYKIVPKMGDDCSGKDVHLHISMLVDISKGNGSDVLEFVCSAWPDNFEIRRVYLLPHQKTPIIPYMGPDFRKLSIKFQKTLGEYLEARGINGELSSFLHGYMMNKDRTELIKWLEKVKSYVEK